MSNIVLYDLPDNYYSVYPDELAKINIEDVHRVARKHIQPEPELVLVVGDKIQLESKLKQLGYQIQHTDTEGQPL